MRFKVWLEERELEEDWGDVARGATHVGLDAIGLIPGAGEAADLANAAMYVGEAEKSQDSKQKTWLYFMAGMSLISMIPAIGDAVGKGSKYLAKAGKLSPDIAAAAAKYWPHILKVAGKTQKIRPHLNQIGLALGLNPEEVAQVA